MWILIRYTRNSDAQQDAMDGILFFSPLKMAHQLQLEPRWMVSFCQDAAPEPVQMALSRPLSAGFEVQANRHHRRAHHHSAWPMAKKTRIDRNPIGLSTMSSRFERLEEVGTRFCFRSLFWGSLPQKRVQGGPSLCGSGCFFFQFGGGGLGHK